MTSPGPPSLGDYPPLLFKDLPLPVIAAVNGIATGGGYALALMCDVRIAAESAKFAELHVKRGIIPGAESWLLPRLVGPSKALELIFTCETLDAREAERVGLVSRVVPGAELLPAARDLAGRIAEMPPLALKLAKRAVYQGLASTLDDSLEFVAYARSVAAQEAARGITDFVQRRK